MYKELVEKLSEGNKWVKIAPPASDSQIENSEASLDVRFPAALVNCLKELDGDGYLLLSAAHIAEYNAMTRELLGEVYEGLDSLLFVAENGCGDYFCYKTENGCVMSEQIYMWEHETNEVEPAAATLADMIEKYYRNEIC